jgi:hypothetical protein
MRGKRRKRSIKAKTLGTHRTFGGKRFRKRSVTKLKRNAKKRCKSLKKNTVKRCMIVPKGSGRKGYGIYTWGTKR